MDRSTTPIGPYSAERGPLSTATPERVNRSSPLTTTTPDRLNKNSPMSAGRDSKGASPLLFEKATSPFNSLSMSAHSKLLERKTADAALKRAMMGREEAEAEMRKLREETATLRKSIEEGKERERKVGERLEAVMDNYGRVKETHAHTQALWEKEIRRARKENFKAQSSIVKLQEELKTARTAAKINEECLAREKERSHAREQEAFTARYNIVGVQEQFEQALERIKVVEQERDAFKTAAKNEEVARIAAEGRLPLPMDDDAEDLGSSANKKLKKRKRDSVKDGARVSLSAMEILSSASSEQEIEELSMQVRWEKQRADRAQEMIEFLQAECAMHCCPCSKSKSRKSSTPQRHLKVPSPAPITTTIETIEEEAKLAHDDIPELTDDQSPVLDSPLDHVHHADEREASPLPTIEQMDTLKPRKQRTSTVFCPAEGTFRTVSEDDGASLHGEHITISELSDEDEDMTIPAAEFARSAREFARTPSVEPPSCAMMNRDRDSLLSLLGAPHEEDEAPAPTQTLNIPTIDDNATLTLPALDRSVVQQPQAVIRREQPTRETPVSPNMNSSRCKVTTTTVPVRDEEEQRRSSFNDKLRTPSSCSNRSFDHNDPALTPTMTREEALAKIRERRRARSQDRSTASSRAKAAASAKRDVSGGKPTKPVAPRSRSRTLAK